MRIFWLFNIDLTCLVDVSIFLALRTCLKYDNFITTELHGESRCTSTLVRSVVKRSAGYNCYVRIVVIKENNGFWYILIEKGYKKLIEKGITATKNQENLRVVRFIIITISYIYIYDSFLLFRACLFSFNSSNEPFHTTVFWIGIWIPWMG